MKQIIYTLIVALLLCSIATASMEDLQPYTIRVIVWDIDGIREANVPVTFAYAGQSATLYSAEDGTLSFSLLNFDDVPDGAYINVSCKYGAKDVSINYADGAFGITFNEPSRAFAMAAFAAMGFAVIALGGGRYLLRRKKNQDHRGDNMENKTEIVETEWKLKRDFGVRALIATLAITGYIAISGLAVYQANTELIKSISTIWMPIILAIIVFYFNGATIRDKIQK